VTSKNTVRHRLPASNVHLYVIALGLGVREKTAVFVIFPVAHPARVTIFWVVMAASAQTKLLQIANVEFSVLNVYPLLIAPNASLNTF
jgi:hypothetical protein